MTLSLNSTLSFVDFLVQVGVLAADNVAHILSSDLSNQKLRAYLLQNGLVTDLYLETLTSQYEHIPYVDLSQFQPDPLMIEKLPPALARQLNVLLLDYQDYTYRLAMSNPLDHEALELVKEHLQDFATPVLVNQLDIERLINLYYLKTNLLYEQLHQPSLKGKSQSDVAASQAASVQVLLDAIISDAHQLKSSDIHLESDAKIFRIRLRVDGTLQEQVIKNPILGNQVMQLLKMLAHIDISESTLPQDGSFQYKVGDTLINIRLSILPIENGQSAVVRILEHAVEFNSLKQVILNTEMIDVIRDFLHQKEGTLLVTGPTGSGKTTTLYTCIKEINLPGNKIISIEDPVEVLIDRVNQTQVSPEAGLDFADALKFCLRQDPDVILLGEIRDEETANVASRAAITGHKVLSTLHTTDTVTAITRLANLNVPGYQIAASLNLVLGQRLLRRLCPNCTVDYVLRVEDKAKCKLLLGGSCPDLSSLAFKEAKGCTLCQQTGYSHRVAAFELLQLDTVMKDYIADEHYQAFKKCADHALVGRRLIDHAFELACSGYISFYEFLTVL